MAFSLGAFPADSVMFQTYSNLFESGKNTVVIAMPCLIIGRALWNMFDSRGTSEYSAIIKDTFIAVLLLASFMSFMRFILELPSFFSTLFENSGTYSINVTDQDHTFVNDLVNFVTIITFWIGAAIYSVFLILVSTIAAYIIVFGTMTRSMWIVKAFFWLLIIMSSWPLLWYIFNVAIRILSQDDAFVNSVLIILFNLLKALSPLLGVAVGLKNPASSAVKSTVGGAAGVIGHTGKIATAGFSKLGGQPIIDNFSEKTSNAKKSMNSMFAKTIPTVGTAAGVLGSTVGRGYRNFVPRGIQSGVEVASNAFTNSKDVFTGNEIPGTSPARNAVEKGARNLALAAAKPVMKPALYYSMQNADFASSSISPKTGQKSITTRAIARSSSESKRNWVVNHSGTSIVLSKPTGKPSVTSSHRLNIPIKMDLPKNNTTPNIGRIKVRNIDLNNGGRL